MKTFRVLTAGCGYVGGALGSVLASEGHEVFGLRRTSGDLPNGVKSLVADLSLPVSLEDIPRGLDFVFYTVSADGPDDDAYRAAYVDGPKNLVGALIHHKQNLRRFFFVSSTGVYAQSNGQWVDEGSPTEPETFSGQRLLEGERSVLDGPFPATVLRLAGIYGPGRTRSIERALKVSVDDGPPDDPPVYTNRIHRDDCAGVLRHLMLLPEPDEIYLGVDHEPADRRTVAVWLAGRFGKPRTSGPASDEKPPVTNRRRTNERRTNKRCNNARLLDSGYQFQYPTYREGYAALLAQVGGKEPSGLQCEG